MDLRTQREAARWYPLIDHPVQLELIGDDKRFKVVPAGRRSGKTERAKRRVAKLAMRYPNERYFLAAPTRDQARQIWWPDMRLLCFESLLKKRPSESNLVIFMNNGTTIHIIGLDKPERIEGQYWSGGVVDEIGNVKETAWPQNIRPALDTMNPGRPDYRPWCWLIGVPEGINHYKKLADYAQVSGDPDWKLYHWKSAEVLPTATIEAAKRELSAREFRQEYEASFETASGRIYDDYGLPNYTSEEIKDHEQLLWHHDFNYTPMSSGIAVMRKDEKTKKQNIFILDEIILRSAIARQSAEEFCDKFKNHKNRKVIVYGDPAGRAGEKHGHQSDYTEIEGVLRRNNWTFERRVKNAAPAIRDRQNAVRARIANAAGERTLFVNPKKARYAHEGLGGVQFKEGSTFLEEETEFQHITTAIGYMIDFEFPVAGRMQTAQLAGV
jgi:hypothetical protein